MYKRIKYFIDFIFAVLGLILLSPIFVFITILLFFDFKESPFFLQRRVGKNNTIFFIVKYKTMKNTKDQNGLLLPDEQRLTKLGTLIRKTSLDEIPQLINVLKGEMSFVGPRPLLTDYMHLYDPIQIRRHEVKPGITGWVQVNGRNAIDWERKFKLDVWYVDNVSFWLDLKILLLTVQKVIKSEGVTQEGQVTTTYFKGNEE
jgi:lipopolysaccharide/colanic/teichoic acid biosynthesis glycosyltransferase